jgi:hypothetical protein
MWKPYIIFLLLCSSAWLTQPLSAQGQSPGEYPGVVPGSGNNLPRVADLKNKQGTWVTWPGFLSAPDGSSRVFLQTIGPFTYERKDESQKIVVLIDNAKVFLNNNRNALETSHFNTPVNRAYLKNIKNKLALIIELRVPAQASLSQTTESDGYSYLIIDFPAGHYPVALQSTEAL